MKTIKTCVLFLIMICCLCGCDSAMENPIVDDADLLVVKASGRIIDLPEQSAIGVYMRDDQSIICGIGGTIEFDTEEFDNNGDFDTFTHSFTASETGIYEVSYSVHFQHSTAGDQFWVTFWNSTDLVSTWNLVHTAFSNYNVNVISATKAIRLIEGKTYNLYAVNLDNDDSIDASFTYMTITLKKGY